MANGIRVTPTLNSRGLFEVQQPFRVRAKQVYEVIAIREFPDFWNEHLDIFTLFYEPVGLTEKDYERDKAVGATIVSLYGQEGVIHLPDTYIVSYPELGLADYQHVVLSVSIGAMHRSRNLDSLKKEIGNLVSKLTGKQGEVRIHVAPVKDTLTEKEASVLEKVRQGNVNRGNTSYIQSQRMRQQFDAIKHNLNNGVLGKYKGLELDS